MDISDRDTNENDDMEIVDTDTKVTDLNGGTSAKAQADAFMELAKQNLNLEFNPRVVLPGDDVTKWIVAGHKKVRLGVGLREDKQRVFSTLAGVLRYKPPQRYWVESSRKRYVPTTEDVVIGIVEDKNADFYKVNIGGTSPAILPVLSFDGATKRNRPNLQVGSLVYSRVVSAMKHMDPELSCAVSTGATRKDWMTGQSTFGELHKGFVFRCSSLHANSLTKGSCAVLNALGKDIPFEVAVGANGFVWVNSNSNEHTVVITNAILNSEFLTDPQIEVMVEQLLSKVSK